MPAGVSWGQYTKFTVAAFLAMCAGSHSVYLYYKPLKDLNVYVEKELEEHGKR